MGELDSVVLRFSGRGEMKEGDSLLVKCYILNKLCI